jgi:hypothetical protein
VAIRDGNVAWVGQSWTTQPGCQTQCWRWSLDRHGGWRCLPKTRWRRRFPIWADSWVCVDGTRQISCDRRGSCLHSRRLRVANAAGRDPRPSRPSWPPTGTGVATVIGWRCPPTPGLMGWKSWLNGASAADPPSNVRPRPRMLYNSGTTGSTKGLSCRRLCSLRRHHGRAHRPAKEQCLRVIWQPIGTNSIASRYRGRTTVPASFTIDVLPAKGWRLPIAMRHAQWTLRQGDWQDVSRPKAVFDTPRSTPRFMMPADPRATATTICGQAV